MKLRKTLCCLDRDDIEEHLDTVAKAVAGARYICRRCARAARKKKHLCKPVRLPVT